MKGKFILPLIAFLFVFGCDDVRQAEKVEKTTNGEIKVEKLFTVDGTTVYRFYDHNYARYFAVPATRPTMLQDDTQKIEADKNTTTVIISN